MVNFADWHWGRVLNGLLSDNTRKNNNKNSYIERVGMANATWNVAD